MDPRARYGVWRNASDAALYRPDHVTWHGANLERTARNGDDELWTIFDYSVDPPKDVNDGDPSLQEAPEDPFLRGAPGDPFPWWVCRYDSHDGSGYKVSGPHTHFFREEVGASNTENRGIFASAIFQCQEKPDYETFALVVAGRLGIILPEEKEQQWCWTTEGGWKLMDGNMVTKYSSPEYQRMGNGSELVRVYGTIANRDERRDAVLKVMREVGPKDE